MFLLPVMVPAKNNSEDEGSTGFQGSDRFSSPSATASKLFLSLGLPASGPPSLGTVAREPSALQILQFHFSNLIIVFLFLWKITCGEKCRDVKEKKSKAEGYFEIEEAKQSEFLKEKRQRKLL